MVLMGANVLAADLYGNLRFGGDVATAHSLDYSFRSYLGFLVRNCWTSVVLRDASLEIQHKVCV